MDKVKSIEYNQDGTINIIDDKGCHYKNCYMSGKKTDVDEDCIIIENCKMVCVDDNFDFDENYMNHITENSEFIV